MPRDTSSTELCLRLEEGQVPHFFPLFQQGFTLRGQTGCSIKSFLCQQLGLDPGYVEKRIQTLFLDGKPVDDMNTAVIRDGSTLAISGAMPGLVGAILRKEGLYASMRATISHQEEMPSQCLKEGKVSLKVFNILLKELAPTLLRKGVWISAEALQEFFGKASRDFWSGCKGAIMDGQEVDCEAVSEMRWSAGEVLLKVSTD